MKVLWFHCEVNQRWVVECWPHPASWCKNCTSFVPQIPERSNFSGLSPNQKTSWTKFSKQQKVCNWDEAWVLCSLPGLHSLAPFKPTLLQAVMLQNNQWSIHWLPREVLFITKELSSLFSWQDSQLDLRARLHLTGQMDTWVKDNN